jgi:ferrochelatase
LKPYTDETVKTLAASGVKRLAVATPGFSVDCLETIDEIGRENAGYFYAAGGEKFARIACLNARSAAAETQPGSPNWSGTVSIRSAI